MTADPQKNAADRFPIADIRQTDKVGLIKVAAVETDIWRQTVNLENLASKTFMARALEDRRAARPSPAPYLTDEGFVLFDRREFGERRKQSFDSLAQLLKIGIPANRG